MIITERNAVKRPVQQQKEKKKKEIWNQDCTCQSKQLASQDIVSHTGVTVKVDPQHWRNANTGEDPHVFHSMTSRHFSSKDTAPDRNKNFE